jgi:hypothetical protein
MVRAYAKVESNDSLPSVSNRGVLWRYAPGCVGKGGTKGGGHTGKKVVRGMGVEVRHRSCESRGLESKNEGEFVRGLK